MEAAEYEGFWWIPSGNDKTEGYIEMPKCEERLGGKLTFSPESGARLHVLGSFVLADVGTKPIYFGQEARKYPFIFGVTVDGRAVILQDCQTLGPTIRVPGFITDEFRVNTIFIHDRGAGQMCYYFNPQQALFDWVAARYTYLLEWTGISGMSETLYFNKKRDNITRTQVQQLRPRQKVRAKLIDNIQAEIGIGYNIDGDTLNEKNFRQTGSIGLTHSVGLVFDDWYSKVIKPLQNLLTFSTDQPNSVIALKAGLKPKEKLEGIEIDELYFDVFFANAQYDREHTWMILPTYASFLLGQLTSQYGSLSKAFGAIVTAWLEMSRDFGRTIDTFLRYRYEPRLVLEPAFISVAQAAESFYSWKFSSKEQADAYETQKQEVLDNVNNSDLSAKDKKWLNARLTNLRNDPSFSDMVSGLLNFGGETATALIGTNSKKFVQQVVRYRNKETHINAAYRSRHTNIIELWNLYLALAGILRACLLRELAERASASFVASEEYPNSYAYLAKLFSKSQIYVHAKSWLQSTTKVSTD